MGVGTSAPHGSRIVRRCGSLGRPTAVVHTPLRIDSEKTVRSSGYWGLGRLYGYRCCWTRGWRAERRLAAGFTVWESPCFDGKR
jgi:hypothetical protein